MTTRIKVMADHGSTGLWDERTYIGLDPVELNLSTQTCQALAQWVSHYDSHSEDWRPPEERKGLLDYAEFTLQGKKLAEQIKKERPDLTVFYFDEQQLHKDLNSANPGSQSDRAAYLVEV